MTKGDQLEFYLQVIDDCIEHMNASDSGCCTGLLESFKLEKRREFDYEWLDKPLEEPTDV